MSYSRSGDAIRHLLATDPVWSAMSPRRINGGQCEDFQRDAIAAAGLDPRGAERCTESLPPDLAESLPGHCWIFTDGLHYDAEAPDGVRDPSDLPIFERALERLARTKSEVPARLMSLQSDAQAKAETAEYLRGVSDTQLWLSRVYGDPLINAEIERRPQLRRARQAELAGEPPQFQSDVAERSLFSDDPDLRYAYKVAGVTALGLVLAGVVYAVTK